MKPIRWNHVTPPPQQDLPPSNPTPSTASKQQHQQQQQLSSTEQLMDILADHPPDTQKQMLGERINKAV
jgi:hypothetical protein